MAGSRPVTSFSAFSSEGPAQPATEPPARDDEQWAFAGQLVDGSWVLSSGWVVQRPLAGDDDRSAVFPGVWVVPGYGTRAREGYCAVTALHTMHPDLVWDSWPAEHRTRVPETRDWVKTLKPDEWAAGLRLIRSPWASLTATDLLDCFRLRAYVAGLPEAPYSDFLPEVSRDLLSWSETDVWSWWARHTSGTYRGVQPEVVADLAAGARLAVRWHARQVPGLESERWRRLRLDPGVEDPGPELRDQWRSADVPDQEALDWLESGSVVHPDDRHRYLNGAGSLPQALLVARQDT